MSGQLQAAAALPPEKEAPVSIGYEDEWAPEPVWTPKGKYFILLPRI
jgi:hypothetical protein